MNATCESISTRIPADAIIELVHHSDSIREVLWADSLQLIPRSGAEKRFFHPIIALVQVVPLNGGNSEWILDMLHSVPLASESSRFGSANGPVKLGELASVICCLSLFVEVFLYNSMLHENDQYLAIVASDLLKASGTYWAPAHGTVKLRSKTTIGA